MKSTLLRAGLAVVVAASAAFGLSACGGSEGAASGNESGTSSDSAVAGDESEAFVADMKEGVQIINDKIAEQADMTQIMLASDVEQPTQKYGMWVMPYYPSEAVESYTMSIQITNGTDFVVTAVSAESGKTWTMDQDGNMAEVTE